MKTALTAAILAVLAAPAAAQEKAEEIWKGIKVGDRVELTLKSEFAIRGKIVLEAIDEDGLPTTKVDTSVDLSKEKTIVLDVAMEYPELTGLMGIERIQVKAVRKLPDLTPEEAKAIEEARKEAEAGKEKEEAGRRARAAKDDLERMKQIQAAEKRRKDEEAGRLAADLQKQAELIKKAKAIYDKFPPEKGWGPEMMQKLQQKALLKQLPTPEEREFAENFELWNQYHQYLMGEKEKKEKKPATPGETPGDTKPPGETKPAEPKTPEPPKPEEKKVVPSKPID